MVVGVACSPMGEIASAAGGEQAECEGLPIHCRKHARKGVLNEKDVPAYLEDSFMQNQSKIVEFSRQSNDVADAGTAQAPEIIRSAKRTAQKHLGELLQKMFDNVDDCLFEYADKAGNNQQQALYFDAMRELRIQKEAINGGFSREFTRLFDKALGGEIISNSGINQQPNSFGTLSLVEDEDLEESLAVTNMTSKMHNLYREPIYALAQRFEHVMAGLQFSNENNPLSPYVVCHAFSEPVSKLNVELEIKLIVYKLFDKFVIQNLGRMFNELNDMFVAAGVLPTIKIKAPVKAPSYHRSRQYLEQEVVPEMTAVEVPINGDNPLGMFESLRGMLTQQRTNTIGTAAYHYGPGAVTGASAGVYGGAMAPANGGSAVYSESCYISQDVIAGLSHLQQSANVEYYDARDQESGPALKSHLIAAISSVKGENTTKSIERAESDVIDIVSMMFDFILDDKTLSDAIRAQIARLQIPIIKVAVMDKAFFGKKTHPARQLLNELAYAGSNFDENLDQDDAVLRKVEDIVNRILEEFSTDISIFENLLLEFVDFVQDEMQANKLAKELLEHAKQTVAHEIERRISYHKTPLLIRSILLDQWKDVLHTIGIRDGCEGATWESALQLADDLIWSVQPKLLAGERQELIRLIPRILNALQSGLTLIACDQSTINELFAELEQLHIACLKGAKVTPDKLTQLNAAENLAGDASMHANPSEEVAGGGPVADERDEFIREQPWFQQVAQRYGNSALFRQVHHMPIGAWVEFYDEDKIRRGKLSWKCDFTGDYTFVDRKYKVVADISMLNLLARLTNATAAIVEDVPLLDRTLDALVNTLRRCVSNDQHLTPQLN